MEEEQRKKKADEEKEALIAHTYSLDEDVMKQLTLLCANIQTESMMLFQQARITSETFVQVFFYDTSSRQQVSHT